MLEPTRRPPPPRSPVRNYAISCDLPGCRWRYFLPEVPAEFLGQTLDDLGWLIDEEDGTLICPEHAKGPADA